MKVYERHLARELVAATFQVLAAFLAFFAFLDLMNELPELGKGGYQFQHALGFVLLSLPGRAYEIMPIAVLVGSLYALTLLARHSEITVLRASGLPTQSLIATLAKLGLIFALLTLLLGELIAPPAERAAKALRLSAQSKLIAQEFRSGLWVKDGHSFINVREVRPDASLRGVRVFEFDEGFRLRSLSEAEEGSFLPPDAWLLKEVAQTRFAGDRPEVLHHEALRWQSALNPDLLAVLLVAPEKMALPTLIQYVRHLAENKQKTQRFEIALWKKLIYPLASLVMMALALPFALSHDRMTAVSVRVFTGVMLGILFHMLNGLFAHLGVINSWRPLIAAAMPSVMFLLAAAVMLAWVERR
ncbi:MAG: LPS export ABC transporter permease LptG [Rhodocyclaceae bacterium]|nr:LPS export ABC transporter permease LptG [Rhodocyclaceae bacterium]